MFLSSSPYTPLTAAVGGASGVLRDDLIVKTRETGLAGCILPYIIFEPLLSYSIIFLA
jgi:hypothetical protein